jgi:membrane fusion protein (multidrug efflux system)
MDQTDDSIRETTSKKTRRRKSVDVVDGSGTIGSKGTRFKGLKKRRSRTAAEEKHAGTESNVSKELDAAPFADAENEGIHNEEYNLHNEGSSESPAYSDAAFEGFPENTEIESYKEELPLAGTQEYLDGNEQKDNAEGPHTVTLETSSKPFSEKKRIKGIGQLGGWRPPKSLVSKSIKLAVMLAIVGGTTYALVRISRPLLISFATWILRTQPQEEDDYYTREVTVEAERVTSSTMPKHIDTIGELKANASVILHSEISGCINEILFIEGSKVKKGELLIKLDDDIHQAEFRAHKAQSEAAQAEFERQVKIRSSGAGSMREYDKALAEMNAAKAKMESSQAQIRRTEIRAPFDGVIGIIDICEGAFVQPNQELVTVVDQTPIKVKFGVPGKYVNDVGVGQSVELRVDAHKDRKFKGTVEAVDSYVDSATNCVALRASIPNEDGALKAGLFASVSLTIGLQGETITIDESAVERMGEQEYVWCVDRGKVRRVPILTGSRERGRVEVIAGLKDKQVVVTSGQRGLSDGRYVKVVNMELEPDPKAEAQSAKTVDQ